MTQPKGMNFRKSSKGGWVIFDPKTYVADFGPLNGSLNRAFFLEKNATQCSENEGGGSKAILNFSENSSYLVA